MVARAGIEPATFRFSGGRSYQLSYLAGRHRSLATECLAVMATLTGLEPATSAVTGRRANQLRHRALLCNFSRRKVPPRTLAGLRPASNRASLQETAVLPAGLSIPTVSYVPPTGFEPALPP